MPVSSSLRDIATDHAYAAADNVAKLKDLQHSFEAGNKKSKKLGERSRQKKVTKLLSEVDLGGISDSQHKELFKKADKISDELLNVLQMKPNFQGSAFPDKIREFSLLLHQTSPKAYKYVRQALDNLLPHENTIKSWLSKLDCTPGFHKQVFDALKKRVLEERMLGKNVYCNLIVDEIHLKSNISFNGSSFDGTVDLGSGESDCDKDVATQAWVFMVNCVNGSWKMPIAHFFISKLNGTQRANLIKMAVENLNETGVITMSVTSEILLLIGKCLSF